MIITDLGLIAAGVFTAVPGPPVLHGHVLPIERTAPKRDRCGDMRLMVA